jgi:hypothetical protein
MKLQVPDTPVVRSGPFKETSFGFGDQRVIMDILRRRMYPNPIKAICQEVMCNARDANREAGRGEEPIVVRIPTELAPTYEVSDHGLGITPERMEGVFVLYGASTKRADNIQTGGFGLGAKTPFAYSDSFTIRTTSDESDGVRRTRLYSAYIDETQLGKLAEMSVAVTPDMPTGTTISVAVKPIDFRAFLTYSIRASRWWTHKPSILHAKVTWPNSSPVVCGTDWFISNDGDSGVLVDEIEYPLNWDYTDKRNVFHYISLFIKCGAAEVSVNANREELDYNATTVEFLRTRIDGVIEEIKEKINKEVESAPNLLEAIYTWESKSAALGNLFYGITPTWRGKKLFRTIDFGLCPLLSTTDKLADHLSFTNVERAVVMYGKPIRSYHNRAYISVKTRCLCIENDTGKPLDKRMLVSSFTADATLDYIWVVTFNSQHGRDWLENTYSWSDLAPIKLSTLPILPLPVPDGDEEKEEEKLVRRTRPKGYKIIPVKRIQDDGTIVNDENKKVVDQTGGVYVLKRDNYLWMVNGKKVRAETVVEAAKWLGVIPYVILNRHHEKISVNWVSLDCALEKRFKEIQDSDDYKAYMTYGEDAHVATLFGKVTINALSAHKWRVSNSFTEWLNKTRLVLEGQKKRNSLHKYWTMLYNTPLLTPENKGVELLEEVHKEFPLFMFLTRSYRLDFDTATNDLISYFELKGTPV